VELRSSRIGESANRIDFEPEPPSLAPAPSRPSPTPDQPPERDLSNRIRGRGFCGLFLVLTDGRQVNIHTTSIRKTQEQELLGRLICGVCRKPFSTYL
jgi:hypothetical protein